MEYGYWNKKSYHVKLSASTGTLTSLWCRKGEELTDRNRLFGSICYTLPTDDLTVGEKPAMTPWVDREAVWEHVDICGDTVLLAQETLALKGKYQFQEEQIHFELEQTGSICSEVGINVPLHFLGKKGGDYRTQLIPTTPYASSETDIQYWYLDSPKGQKLLLVASGARAWKLDYSEYVCGHFIQNLKWLYQLDKMYGEENDAPKLVLDIFFPDSFLGALSILSTHLKRPVSYADVYCVGAGEQVVIHVLGEADMLELYQEERKVAEVPLYGRQAVVRLPEPGIYRAVPKCGALRGLECVVGAIEPYETLFHKNIKSLKKPYHCDRGLCEGGVWAQAACLHQRLLGLDEDVEKRLEEQIADILGEDSVRIPRCTIPAVETEGWPAYHVYHSLRTQEAFAGVAFFVEAYRTYGKRQYLEYAVRIMETLEENYILENGQIIRRAALHGKEYVDYTTVTAPVLAVVDLARLLKELGDSRAKHYEGLAEKIADYLVNRGFQFPTEGGCVELTEPEMEDGSISCTALSVLYVCYWVCRKEAYIRFAGEVLELHESWCMKTPDVRMHRSTLRWWETLWEGDKDGPAICAGHAWTLWRAEADFYYGLLTEDPEAFLKSYHAFGTSLVKIGPDGSSYACYQPDKIPGGGFHDRAQEVEQKLKGGYPKNKDQSLSKYLWVRMEHTWWNTCVVLPGTGPAEGVRNSAAGKNAAVRIGGCPGDVIVLNARLAGREGNTLFLRETVTPVKRIINLTGYRIKLCSDKEGGEKL